MQNSFVTEAPAADTTAGKNTAKQPGKLRLKIDSRSITACKYKEILTGQMQLLKGLYDDDEIELNVEM